MFAMNIGSQVSHDMEDELLREPVTFRCRFLCVEALCEEFEKTRASRCFAHDGDGRVERSTLPYGCSLLYGCATYLISIKDNVYSRPQV